MRAARRLAPVFAAAMVVTGLATPTAAHAVTPATVGFATPTGGSVVDGVVTVTVDGNVDPTALNATTTVLYVDGTAYATSTTCTWSPGADCRSTFTWDAGALAGPHTLGVMLADNPDATSVGETITVIVHTGSRISLAKPAAQRAGRTTYVHGTVRATNNGAPLADTAVRLTLAPAVGHKKVVTAHTGAAGGFTVPVRLAADTTVTAAVVAAPGVGPSTTKRAIAVLAPIACKADRTVRHGAFGNGTCTVPHLPAKTKVTLQYASGHAWHTLGTGRASGPTVPIAYSFPRRGTYKVRLVVAASRVYATTYGTPVTVTVT